MKKRTHQDILMLVVAVTGLAASMIFLWNFYAGQKSDATIWYEQYGDTVQAVAQSVVAIDVQVATPVPDVYIRQSGSGFIIDPDGIILTNEHVINQAEQIQVVLADQRRFSAHPIGADPRMDIALLKIDARDLKPCSFGNVDYLSPGQIVIAMGNPLNTAADGRPVATFGHINKLNQRLRSNIDPENDRYYDNLIQSTAFALPGSSGGPLINSSGQVIGIVTAMTENLQTRKQFGFAICLDRHISDSLSQFLLGQTVQHGFLGLEFASFIDQKTQKNLGISDISGALVAVPMLGFPARRAGIRSGDLIRSLNGQRIHNPSELTAQINRMKPRQTVQLDIIRQTPTGPKTHTIPVPLTERNLQDLQGYQTEAMLNSILFWGIQAKPLTPWRIQRMKLPSYQPGVLIYDVQPGSPADLKAIQPGWILTAVKNQPVRNINDFARLAQTFQEAPIPEMEFLKSSP